MAGPTRNGDHRPGYPRSQATDRPVNQLPVSRKANPRTARVARDNSRRRRGQAPRANSAALAAGRRSARTRQLPRSKAGRRAVHPRVRARVPLPPRSARAAPLPRGAATRRVQSRLRTMSSTRAACAASAGRAPPISQSARSGSAWSSSHSKAWRRCASAAGQHRSSQRTSSTSSSFIPRRQRHLSRPCIGSRTVHSSRSRMRRLMSAIARAGFRSFGQASVQFMIVWQR